MKRVAGPSKGHKGRRESRFFVNLSFALPACCDLFFPFVSLILQHHEDTFFRLAVRVCTRVLSASQTWLLSWDVGGGIFPV